MKQIVVAALLGAGAVALVAGGGWLVVSRRVAELESRLAVLDRSASERTTELSSRLQGADRALEEGRSRDAGLSDRLAEVAEEADRAAQAADRAETLEERVDRVVEELRRADDENVQLVQSWAERIEDLQERTAWMEDAWEELPLGTVLPWLPTRDGEIPAGWEVCNGANGTPDLRGLFLRGTGSAGDAGLFYEATRMSSAGLHVHDNSSPNHTRFGMNWSPTRPVGEARAIFDTDVGTDSPEARAMHGQHVHEDPNVPAHVTVLFIIKLEYA